MSLSQGLATLNRIPTKLIIIISWTISVRCRNYQLLMHFKKSQVNQETRWERSNHLFHLNKCTYKAISRRRFRVAHLLSSNHQCQVWHTAIVPNHSSITRVNTTTWTNLHKVSRDSTCSILSSRAQFSNLLKLKPATSHLDRTHLHKMLNTSWADKVLSNLHLITRFESRSISHPNGLRISQLLQKWQEKGLRENKSQCLTSSLLNANKELMQEPLRPDQPQDPRQIASATPMQKNSPLTILPTSCLRSLQRRSVNASQSSITRLARLKKVALLNVITLMKAHGRERWRLSFADSGCKDFRARTRWKSKAVALHTAKRNFKRKRDSADNTLHQFVRIS